MKKFKVKEIIWIDGKGGKEAFAVKGEEVFLLPDNNTLVKKGRLNKIKTNYFDNIDCLVKQGALEEVKEEKKPETSMVINPPHYAWFKERYGVPFEDIVGDMNFNLGNVLKYVVRHGHKFENGMTTKEKAVQDLEKAVTYLGFEIKRLKNG